MIRAHITEMTIEEVANALTHGLGLVLSVAGFVGLLVWAVLYGDSWHIAGSIVYGSSLVILYAASTFYHTAITPHRKRFLQLLDHCCIYLLIAGTYTPFLLTVLREIAGWQALAIVWVFAVVGILLKVLFRDRLNALGIVLYLLMGWAGVVGILPVYHALGLTATILVAGGGISYTLGMIFFGWKSLKHHHAVFHIFVLGGSILHYIVIAGFLMRSS